ncbi:sialate O-acetylesterase [Haloferula sp.]|uniref:sialate O-acetylesterase n=1 Tax=Haloferula sp. TaxID=2497595 RepID=UPI003C76FE42
MPRYPLLCRVPVALLASLLGLFPAFAEKPVKVYILAGQSNMVGIGQVTGGGSRWGSEFVDPVLSLYAGDYDPESDYDKLQRVSTLKLDEFGGTKPTPYPGGGTQVVRGFLVPKQTGTFEFRPGYGDSAHNIMQVDGTEVYRKEVGRDPTYTPMPLTKGQKVPFKITYLTANANGLGWMARLDIPGTLSTEVRQNGRFPYLIDDNGNWITRDDVFYKGVVTATANQWLSIGCGAGGNNIGPELGFGHLLGNHHEEPVLILKASQGNRSLAWDFLPPGSERFEKDGKIYAGYKDSPFSWDKGTSPEPINWYAGKQYDDCFGEVKKVLANFDESFPHWKGRSYEIAGFGWWQGHKDTGSELTAQRYEQNLVNLIKALRKEFAAPDAPFVIATVGFEGRAMEGNTLTVANAQLAVDGDTGKYPEFKGNVKTVDTRDFWPDSKESPKEQGFHYHQNAGTYMKVGEAMGQGMLELLKGE